MSDALKREVSTYSIGQVAEMTGISAYTLRYYDKCGFFPDLARDKHNVRSFEDKDIEWLQLIDSLRKSGLSIEGIQYFVRLYSKGESKFRECHKILQTQETTLEYQLKEIQENLKILQQKKQCLEQLMET